MRVEYWLATLLAIACVVAPDAAALGLAISAFALGGVALGLAPFLATDTVTALAATRLSHRRLRGAALIVVSVVPFVYAAICLAPTAFEVMPEGMPIMGAVAMLAVLGLNASLRRWSPSLGLPDDPRFGLAALAAAAELSVLFLWAHHDEATLTLVNPGTEGDRQLLYVAMWVASLVLFVPWSLRIWVRSGAELTPRPAVAWSAVSLATGTAFLVADREWMVDLHPSIHLWLIYVGVLSLDAGLSLALNVVITSSRRRWFRIAGVVPLVILGAAAGRFYAHEPDVGSRARVGEASFGRALLRLHPAKTEQPLPDVRDAPGLHYPRYHDYPVADNDFNFILLTIDALRADYVPGEGVPPDPAPNMAKLASESLNFTHTYTTGTRTAIGVGSLLVGRYSANIDWHIWMVAGSRKKYRLVRRDLVSGQELSEITDGRGFTTFPDFEHHGTLALRMREAGYHTMGVPYGSRRASKWFSRHTGFGLGFDDLHEYQKKLPSPSPRRVIKHAFEQIDAARRDGHERWFQWIHLYATHGSGKKRSRYRRLVSQVDHGVGRLIHGLKRRGLYERTVIVLTSDHGEAFGEHRHRGHASSLYREQALVPMLIRIPGMEAREFGQATSTLDGVATILALGHADLEGIDGQNLLPMAEGVSVAPRPVFTELHRYRKGRRNRDLHGIILDGWKLIYDRKRQTVKLYNLSEDPDERHNLVEEQPEKLYALGAVLAAFLYQGESNHPLP